MYDVAIIGGGPAGSAAAIALCRSGRSVALIERTRYGAPRIGETLPPDSRPLLERLGVTKQFHAEHHVPAPGVISAWGNDTPYVNDFIVNPYGDGWHLDRTRFDRMMAMHARDCGARVHEQTRVVACSETAGHWQLRMTSGDGEKALRCRFLIDANGRRDSVLKRRAGAPIVYDRLVGITAFMPARANINRYTLIESVPAGWWYSALLPNDRCVVTFMTDADLARTGRKDLAAFLLNHLQSAKLTAERIEAAQTNTEVSIVPAMSYRRDCSHGDNWLLAGDAAATRDPLSGQGVCKALESGLAAAAAINGALKGDRNPLSQYSNALKSAHDRYLRTRTDFYRAERRWPDSPFWQRRQRSN